MIPKHGSQKKNFAYHINDESAFLAKTCAYVANGSKQNKTCFWHKPLVTTTPHHKRTDHTFCKSGIENRPHSQQKS